MPIELVEDGNTRLIWSHCLTIPRCHRIQEGLPLCFEARIIQRNRREASHDLEECRAQHEFLPVRLPRGVEEPKDPPPVDAAPLPDDGRQLGAVAVGLGKLLPDPLRQDGEVCCGLTRDSSSTEWEHPDPRG